MTPSLSHSLSSSSDSVIAPSIKQSGPPLTNGFKARWQAVSTRKMKDREDILAQYPEWRLKKPVSSDVTDVSHVYAAELSPREVQTVEEDATSLLENIRTRKYTSREVIQAYCHAAVVAQDLTNCLTEIHFNEAFQRADELDEYLARTGNVVGPLHGLPFSIKDHVMVKGWDTSTGYISWAYKKIAQKDAVVVDILRQAGAVIYVKTANPQTLLSLETNNNIYGRTLNPFNRNLTPGGSSGGEGALIACHGSPIGLGTDIGGSIRIPAVHSGLFGLKASVARFPHAGLEGSHDGMEAIIGALGPMARSLRDILLFCKVVLSYKPWVVEPPLIELPWKEDLANGVGIPEKLSIAILWDDGVVAPHPPIKQSLSRLRATLTSAGHEVIDWEPIDHLEAWQLMTKLYFLDGGEEYREVLAEAGEPAVPQTEWILGQVPNNGRAFSIGETFRLNRQREDFRFKLAQHWNETKLRTSTGRAVDAILCPASPTLAPPHDTTRWWGYTSYWNLADYSTVVFPVGQYRANAVHEINGFQAAQARNEIEQFVKEQWNNPAQYHGSPIGLQLVTRRFNEEYVLGIMGVIDRLARSSE